MGKKRTLQQANLQHEEDEVEELDAEIRALAAMREEKVIAISGKTPSSHYNNEGLIKCIEGTDLPFVESMVISDFAVTIEDENDDLERELAFYNQTIRAVNLGRQQLEDLGVPTRRPIDYFCEQVKSDAHMAKIKDRLLLEEKKIEGFEKRVLRDNNRKFNKQVSALKTQAKSKATNKMLDDVKELKKSSKRDKGSDIEEGLHRILNKSSDQPKKSFKRANMDKKYGFGGKDHKKNKINDKKSINDFSDFNPRGGKFVKRDDAFKGSKKKGKPNRPGKATRDAKRSSN